MNQAPAKSFYLLSILIGILAFLSFNLSQMSLELWHNSYLADNTNNYQIFYWGLSCGAFLIGLLINIESLNNPQWKIGAYTFLIFNIIILITCLVFPLDEKNEEFTIYTAQANTAWIYFLIGLGIFFRFLTNNKIHLLRIVSAVLIGSLSGALFYNVITLLPFIYMIHLWLISAIIMVLLINVSRMQIVK